MSMKMGSYILTMQSSSINCSRIRRALTEYRNADQTTLFLYQALRRSKIWGTSVAEQVARSCSYLQHSAYEGRKKGKIRVALVGVYWWHRGNRKTLVENLPSAMRTLCVQGSSCSWTQEPCWGTPRSIQSHTHKWALFEICITCYWTPQSVQPTPNFFTLFYILLTSKRYVIYSWPMCCTIHTADLFLTHSWPPYLWITYYCPLPIVLLPTDCFTQCYILLTPACCITCNCPWQNVHCNNRPNPV